MKLVFCIFITIEKFPTQNIFGFESFNNKYESWSKNSISNNFFIFSNLHWCIKQSWHQTIEFSRDSFSVYFLPPTLAFSKHSFPLPLSRNFFLSSLPSSCWDIFFPSFQIVCLRLVFFLPLLLNSFSGSASFFFRTKKLFILVPEGIFAEGENSSFKFNLKLNISNSIKKKKSQQWIHRNSRASPQGVSGYVICSKLQLLPHIWIVF